jgi:NAD+ kinase
MWDACIVVDGSLSFSFNDGAVVELGIHDEDALRCVQLD